jgi:hypothetical protein
MGLNRIVLKSDMNSRTWVIAWTIRNFGTLPAIGVDASLELKAGINAAPEQGPVSAEVFPQGEVESVARFVISEIEHSRLVINDLILAVSVRISYAAADGRKFRYSAEAQFKFDTGAFIMLRSQTEPA